jgi:hypothetical protein
MTTLVQVTAGILLVAHGLVHLLFVVPAAADPSYPFSLDRSWLVPGPARRPFAHVLMGAVVLAFVAAALAWWGVPGLDSAWTVIVVVAACLSLVLLIAFWDVRLIIGVLIDVLLIGIAVFSPSWVQAIRP